MRNVEYKAELRDIDLARSVCGALGAVHAETVEQTDTYFNVADFRLKRREASGHDTEYIEYRRPDASRARTSEYTIYTERAARDRFGEVELPVRVIVRKVREIHLLDNVRVHLDRVDGLGTFLEFEAVVSEDRPMSSCREAVARLREAFSACLGEPISSSYSDLMVGRG